MRKIIKEIIAIGICVYTGWNIQSWNLPVWALILIGLAIPITVAEISIRLDRRWSK